MTLNLLGSTFGRLKVVEKTKLRAGGSIVWRCHCKCGNKFADISTRDLVNVKVPRKGCGICADTKHELYSIWSGMVARCADKTNKDYGGRGIQVCQRWKDDFLNFVEDVGVRPSQIHSIDRFPDNNGNYEPGNVRWATIDQQANNRRLKTYGLTDEQILEIYYSKEVGEILATRYNVSTKTIYNIKSNSYSLNATGVVVDS